MHNATSLSYAERLAATFGWRSSATSFTHQSRASGVQTTLLGASSGTTHLDRCAMR